MEDSNNNEKALENMNNKLVETKIDRGILATYFMSPLSKIINPENTCQFKLVKDSNSNKFKDLLLQNSMLITLHDNLLTFRDTGKEFEIKGDLLILITNEN